MIFWAPTMGHFSVLCGTHCSSSKLGQDHSQLLLFLVGILWYWHLQNAEVFCCKDLHFPQQPVIVLLHGAELQLLCMTSSILLLSQRLHLHQWPLLEPQLLSMSPHAFETSTTWAVPALLSSTASKFQGLAHIWITAPFCSPKTFPRFHLNNTCLFLITTNFLTFSQPASSILTE